MKKNYFAHSKFIKWSIIGIGILIILLLVFRAGMAVGYRRASFSFGWGESYYKNFTGTRPGMIQNLHDTSQFLNDHGAIGQIIKIDGQYLTVRDPHDAEKIIVITSDTQIRKLNSTIASTDLAVGDHVTVIGQPSSSANGQIEATLIRVMPNSPQNQ